ncbi:hypothetical protein RB195_001625 [Necator americanus]|uniref:Reverse transcriptase domain-containing protein n=1 Tax=Necator americanus TaxID=51031 RepID=A0ABR1DF67_NECAM
MQLRYELLFCVLGTTALVNLELFEADEVQESQLSDQRFGGNKIEIDQKLSAEGRSYDANSKGENRISDVAGMRVRRTAEKSKFKKNGKKVTANRDEKQQNKENNEKETVKEFPFWVFLMFIPLIITLIIFISCFVIQRHGYNKAVAENKEAKKDEKSRSGSTEGQDRKSAGLPMSALDMELPILDYAGFRTEPNGPTYAVNEEPPTVSEVLVCIQKMKNGKSGGDDGISTEMLKYLPPSGIRGMTKIIRSIWIDERMPDSWRHAIIIPLHKKLSVTDPRNYRGISLLRVMYKVLERIILDRLIKHREETTRDEQAGFPPGRSIDQVFIVRRVIEIWQWYSKPMQLAFLDFEAAFDSPHRGRLLNALSADGVPRKFVRLLDDMNHRTTAAVRTPAGCTTPFEVVTGVRQGAVAGPFLFSFAINGIMRRTVDQSPADIVLAPSGCPLTDLAYADDAVIFAESSTKLQHVVNLVSKLAAAYGLRLRPDKCKQMWISSRPRTGIRVDGQPIELVDEFCYLGCTLKNNGSYERDVQQRCAKATSAFKSLQNACGRPPSPTKSSCESTHPQFAPS